MQKIAINQPFKKISAIIELVPELVIFNMGISERYMKIFRTTPHFNCNSPPFLIEKWDKNDKLFSNALLFLRGSSK